MPTTTVSSRRSKQRSPQSRELQAVQRRVEEYLDREIDFVPNESFSRRGAEKKIVPDDLAFLDEAAALGSAPKDLPPHLARLCEAPLLSEAEEKEYFRLMNFCKFRANALRARLNPKRPQLDQVEKIDRLLEIARRVRDHILRANMRLVISVVKKFVVPQFSFDEMLSEGISSLMQAVDKFDYDRGFRFSTYAYRAIARNAFRQVTQRHRDQSRACSISAETGLDVPDERRTAGMAVDTWLRLRDALANMLGRLDPRERFILEGRFAMGDSCKIRTFQSLADELGVSKERVRQLEQRAVLKLQRMAEAAKLDEFSACLA